jgi:RNA polymerase sigma-70 factor (ECF subfamily)
MAENDEEALIREAQRNPQAFIAIYDRYVDRIYAFAMRQTGDDAIAKDVTSATFEKALRSIGRYQWRGVSVGAWLYRIAHNEIVQHYRHDHLVVQLPALLRSDMDVERHVQRRQESEALFAALGRLSAADQELIVLRFLEALSSAEVAEILGCSLPNVYLRLHRALNRFRKEFESMEVSNEEPDYVSE